MYIPLIFSFCAATRLQCVDYESIIWDWQPCSHCTACQAHSRPPSSTQCSPSVLAQWPSDEDWMIGGGEWKCKRITEKYRLGEAADGESATPPPKNNRDSGVEDRGSMQLQLTERFCARKYANFCFVWAVDWPFARRTRQCRQGNRWARTSLLGTASVTSLI